MKTLNIKNVKQISLILKRIGKYYALMDIDDIDAVINGSINENGNFTELMSIKYVSGDTMICARQNEIVLRKDNKEYVVYEFKNWADLMKNHIIAFHKCEDGKRYMLNNGYETGKWLIGKSTKTEGTLKIFGSFCGETNQKQDWYEVIPDTTRIG